MTSWLKNTLAPMVPQTFFAILTPHKALRGGLARPVASSQWLGEMIETYYFLMPRWAPECKMPVRAHGRSLREKNTHLWPHNVHSKRSHDVICHRLSTKCARTKPTPHPHPIVLPAPYTRNIFQIVYIFFSVYKCLLFKCLLFINNTSAVSGVKVCM